MISVDLSFMYLIYLIFMDEHDQCRIVILVSDLFNIYGPTQLV